MDNQFEISDELNSLLSSARNEPSGIFARKSLREITEKCKERIQRGSEIAKHAIIASDAFSELAQLENNIIKRKQYRRDALRICKEQMVKSDQFDSNFAINYADKAVNLFYDQFIREEKPLLNSILADAKKAISSCLKNEDNTDTRAHLLCENSSILRCQSQISNYKESHNFNHEALRASNKALNESPENQNAYLSLGQSLWHVARRVSDDSKYFSFMNKAEEALIKAQSKHNPVSTLVLARFYRQTYRPSLAISTWLNYSNHETRNKRRLLAESFLAGEAAMQLWFNNFESSHDALKQVVVFLREAFDAGYENSRIFMALASVEAALGNSISANSVIKNIYQGDEVDWNIIVKNASNALKKDDIDLFENSFAIGISDSSTWNALGTYAKNFMNDRRLAINMYEIGRHLNPQNYILLTNISRTLTEEGDNESLALAERYLSQAKNYSHKNKSFIWWKSVEDLLIDVKKISRCKPCIKSTKLNLPNLYIRFQQLEEGIVDPHARGSHFEELFFDLLTLTFGIEVIQSSHFVEVGSERGVDASFKFSNIHYRVELKWHERPVGPGMLDSFNTKLNTAEVRGLFISMSGFTGGAIKNACEIGKRHTIILMDGVDVKSIFRGHSRLELLLQKKLDFFQRKGNPYLKFADIAQPDA